jgi:hypothetical protein
MELIDDQLFLGERPRTPSLCANAYSAHSETQALKMFSANEILDEETTARVLRGLAKISLQDPKYDCHGLSQHEADRLIGELSGDVEDFFRPILNSY